MVGPAVGAAVGAAVVAVHRHTHTHNREEKAGMTRLGQAGVVVAVLVVVAVMGLFHRLARS